ncbi:MAG: SOS response-associated peptidase [Parvularculaceae bacterium]|nr:SOS response-associated peptidase [Parvularculaceae bacterium]
MCGRFLLTCAPERVAAEFGVDLRENFPPRWNIAPAQPIALVRTGAGRRREFALARWGFIPGWAGKEYFDRIGSKPLFNARGETLAEKATFKNAARRRRCLIPANGYYDWRTENGARKPYLIQMAGERPIALAGVWETAVDPDGGEIDTAAIITVCAGPDLENRFAREPVVIAGEQYRLWLDDDERSAKDALSLLQPCEKGAWRARAVSAAVNNVRNEGAELAAALKE